MLSHFFLRLDELVGHAVLAGGDQSGGADELVALVFAQGRLGHGGEGQVVVLQDGQAVLRLLLLHIEHLPQLLELLQLAEGLQHHQHDDQAQDQVHWWRRGRGGRGAGGVKNE